MFIYYIKYHLNVYLLYQMSIKCLFIISKCLLNVYLLYSNLIIKRCLFILHITKISQNYSPFHICDRR